MSETKPPTELVGAHYRILGRAKTDAETITFRAQDARSGETVALLVLRAPSENAEAASEAFRRAAHRWTGLTHPAVPQVLVAGNDRGVEYAVTEWPGDISLAQLIQKSGGLSLSRMADIGLQLCSLFQFFRQAGLFTQGMTISDFVLNPWGDLRCMPGAVAAAVKLGAGGSPSTDAAQIGRLLKEMAGSCGAEALLPPEFRLILYAATAPNPADRYPDPAAMAQALHAYWRSRWRSLPNRIAFRFLPLSEPPAQSRTGSAAPARRPWLWEPIGIAALVIAVAAVLGLIPLWSAVYGRFARPVAVAPLPAMQNQDNVLIPDLTGLDEGTAWNLLDQAGLRLLVASQVYSEEIPLGKVARQTPEGGQRAPQGTTVQVVLSKGSGKTVVPDVTGQSYAAAEALLAQNNLNATREDLWSEGQPDVVLAQDPPPNTQVVPGTAVALRVAAGRSLIINAALGDVARLHTVEPDKGSLRPGDTLNITLRWQALRPVQERFSVFVHLVDANGVIVAQDDNEPARGSRPTISWAAGEVIPDAHALTLPASAPPGEYLIRVGLYLPGPNQRLPVVDAGRAETQGDALIVHRITVNP